MPDKENDDSLEKENNDKSEDKGKRTIKLILLFLIVFVILFLGVYFAITLYNQYMVEEPVETTTQAVEESTDEEGSVENPIDFDTLQSQNSEIYAYIKIEDTNVDYPIVQSSVDDEFYLKHSAEDKSWSASGAIYTESVNSKDFSDRITVIYGHNGYSDTFFTTLHKFEDEEFFDSHPYFYIYTPTRKLTYQIISAFKYDNRHIMNSFNFSDSTQLEEFQQYILNPNSALKNVRDESELETTVDLNSKIVILSTCVTNQKSSRYLVCGVLVKDEKTY